MDYRLKSTLSVIIGVILISIAFIIVNYTKHTYSLFNFLLYAKLFLALGIFFFLFGAIAEVKNKYSNSSFYPAISFQSSSLCLAFVSPKWKIIKINKLCCDLLGYQSSELLQMDFQRLIHADDFKNDVNYYQKLLTGEINSHVSRQRYLDKNGDSISLYVVVTLNNDNSSKPFFVFEFRKDSSEKSASE